MQFIITLIAASVIGLSFHELDSWKGAIGGFSFALLWTFLYHKKAPHWLCSLLCGSIGFAIACPWFMKVMSEYFKLSSNLTYFWFSIISISVGIQFAAVHFLQIGFARSRAIHALALPLPLAWITGELLAEQIFPWSLAHTTRSFLSFTQIADIGGCALISFIMLWIMQLILKSIFEGKFIPLLSAATLLFTTLLYGKYQLSYYQEQIVKAPTLSARLVQPDFDPAYHFNDTSREQSFLRMQKLSKLEGKTDLIIWPESAVGFSLLDRDQFLEPSSTKDPLPDRETALLFGGQTRVPKPPIRGKFSFYNSVFVLDKEGNITDRYDKQKLLPFAEEYPGSDYYPQILDFSPVPYIVTPGIDQMPVKLSYDWNGFTKTANAALAICYEDMISGPIHSLFIRNNDLHLLIGVASDIWFLDTIANIQHHEIASFRAIEFRKSLIRVATDGVTALVTPIGEEVARLAPYTHGAMQIRAPILEGKTIYALYGHLSLKWLAVIFTIYSSLFLFFGRSLNREKM